MKAIHAIVIITALGAALRFSGLADESLRLDEGFLNARISGSYLQVLRHWDMQWQGSLFALVEKCWCDLFGHSETSLRVLPALFGTLAIPALYLLGRMLFSDAAAIVASLLLSINPYAIYFSQDARPYSLVLLLSIVSIYCAAQALRMPSSRWRTLFALSAISVLYVHPYGIFLLPLFAALPFLVIEQSSAGSARRPYFMVIAGIVAVSLPMLLIFGRTFLGKIEGKLHDADFIPQASFSVLGDTFVKYFMSVEAAVFIGMIILSMLIIAFIRRSVSAGLRIPAALAVCSLLIPLLVSYLLTPIFFYRYMIPGLVALLLILGWALTSLHKSLCIFFLLVLFTLSAKALADYYTRVDKDPWRQMAGYVQPHLTHGDLVIVNPPWIEPLVRYYLPTVDSTDVSAPWNISDLPADITAHPRIWFITAYKVTANLRAGIRQTAEYARTCEEFISVRDSITVNPQAYFVGDIQAALYARRPI